MRTTSFTRLGLLAAAGTVAATVAITFGLGQAQHQHSGQGQETPGAPAPASPTADAPSARAPRRVTMEELHRAGGVPRGWKFAVPAGDPSKGRQAFADLECFKCHVIKGELLPAPSNDPNNAGPELTGMGAEHPAEYIAESILAPNHVIIEGPGYSGPDGLSTMPSFIETLSLAQWLDMVAYLKSLRGVSHAPHAGREIAREKLVGDYRIRMVYLRSESAEAKPSPGRLSVFVTDRESDEAVPYLPVTAAVQALRRPTERLRLGPMMDEQGFHYGLEITLPPRTQKIILSIGPTAMQLAGSVKGKFAQSLSVPFDWEPEQR